MRVCRSFPTCIFLLLVSGFVAHFRVVLNHKIHLHTKPYTLQPTLQPTLNPTHYNLHTTTYTLQPTLNPTPYTLHPTHQIIQIYQPIQIYQLIQIYTNDTKYMYSYIVKMDKNYLSVNFFYAEFQIFEG